MEKTLVLFSHPALEKSRANKALLARVADLEGVTVHDLYECYPDFQIDVHREQALLEEHQRIVWQHPFYWYSTPALMKEWFDVVLQFGWAYGKSGTALVGKTVRSVVTTGGGQEAYCKDGQNRYTVRELLRPLEQTARLCGMTYEDPLVIYGALHLDEAALAAAADSYRSWLLTGARPS
jgi:glutathione-regulated potassium-efflux system ancillary protein KefG